MTFQQYIYENTHATNIFNYAYVHSSTCNHVHLITLKINASLYLVIMLRTCTS